MHALANLPLWCQLAFFFVLRAAARSQYYCLGEARVLIQKGVWNICTAKVFGFRVS